MSLSPSRVSGLLDELAQNGEIVEIRDTDQPSRKLWALADRAAPRPDDESSPEPGSEPAQPAHHEADESVAGAPAPAE
jgi:hypothetical protein